MATVMASIVRTKVMATVVPTVIAPVMASIVRTKVMATVVPTVTKNRPKRKTKDCSSYNCSAGIDRGLLTYHWNRLVLRSD